MRPGGLQNHETFLPGICDPHCPCINNGCPITNSTQNKLYIRDCSEILIEGEVWEIWDFVLDKGPLLASVRGDFNTIKVNHAAHQLFMCYIV